jgi:glycosyltransferase involved in cell wall biosynthesis
MSVGTPVVVTTAVGASRAIVKDGVNGRVVQEGNENVLATAIEDLLSSPDILNEMGREAKRSFVEFNDYNRMASQFERGIREAIE